MAGPADRPEQGRDAEHAHPDTLDRIDGLQTQVATAETDGETVRTAARECCPGGGDAPEGGGMQGCEREGPGASQGSMAARAMTCGLGA
jgi:hypothetical protein